MSARTDERVDSIEHLDHDPHCQEKGHANPVAADYWLDWHGCLESFDCAAHLARFKRKWEEESTGDGMRCKKCRRVFDGFLDAVTVVPL